MKGLCLQSAAGLFFLLLVVGFSHGQGLAFSQHVAFVANETTLGYTYNVGDGLYRCYQ